jgi:hypothetical protein
MPPNAQSSMTGIGASTPRPSMSGFRTLSAFAGLRVVRHPASYFVYLPLSEEVRADLWRLRSCEIGFQFQRPESCH